GAGETSAIYGSAHRNRAQFHRAQLRQRAHKFSYRRPHRTHDHNVTHHSISLFIRSKQVNDVVYVPWKTFRSFSTLALKMAAPQHALSHRGGIPQPSCSFSPPGPLSAAIESATMSACP